MIELFVCEQCQSIISIKLTYIYKMFYVNLMIIIKQKPRFTKDKEKGIKSYHYRKYQFTKAVTGEEERKKGNTKQPENN